MKKDIRDFIIFYKKWYSKDFCDETVNQLKGASYEKHTFYSPISKYEVNVGDDCYLINERIPNDMIIFNDIPNIINRYIFEDMGFEWAKHWEGYTFPKFNRYEIGTSMKEHCDHISTIFDGTRKGLPMLSILGCLNDDYEGGELIFFTDTQYQLGKGDIMVFPSNFLYPHRITNLTKGQRFSVVSWVW